MYTKLSFQKILWAFFAFIALMITVRFLYSGQYAFVFLVWNLFLAWVPLVISAMFNKMTNAPKWKQGLLFAIWLAFFPNAFYLVTDLIHLDLETSIPKWFDALLLFSCLSAGLLMAFVSLLRTEVYLQQKFETRTVQLMMPAIFFLSSFGVYLGRFQRWNSWDIISDPLNLLYSIARLLIFPVKYAQAWGITLMLTCIFYLLYLAIKKLPGHVNQAIQ
ncbi:DUF1361 domain-containing protein [Ferruginibacter sp.]